MAYSRLYHYTLTRFRENGVTGVTARSNARPPELFAVTARRHHASQASQLFLSLIKELTLFRGIRDPYSRPGRVLTFACSDPDLLPA
jgi:hypothetical protein